MVRITIEEINDICDVNRLYQLEQLLNYDISLLSSSNIKDEVRIILSQEAVDYGISTLNQYIKMKLNNHLTIKQACINRSIEIKKLSLKEE